MKKILVVNNDYDTMMLLTNWLEKKSYNVKFTGKMEDVPKLLREFVPQLVIADILQYEVVENIKKNKEFSSVPVLLMTGYTAKSKNNNLPVNDVIEKPFNLPLLEKKIERLIAQTV